jgi:glycosyltransferase involved in cell wall biosynthesis
LLLQGFAEFCRRQPGAAVLEVVGSMSGQSEFASEIAARGLVDSVRFRGRLTRSALAQLRSQCHAFAAAPVDEPFGLVFAEAAAAGLVLIVPDHGGPCEIALDGRGGVLIDIFDPQNIAMAFSRVLELSPVEREELRQEAFVGARARFDRAQLGPRLAGKLERLLGAYDTRAGKIPHPGC